MKNILFISGIQIFPPESGGQLRSANICKGLVNQGFNVSIYSYTGRKKDYLKFMRSNINIIDSHLSEFTNRNLLFGFIQHLFYRFNLPPLWLTWLCSFYCPSILKQKMKVSDSILLDFPYLYPVVESGKRVFHLNTHNAEFELFKEESLISRLVKKIELQSFMRAKSIFFCSPNDQLKFIRHYPEVLNKSCLLPNGVDLKEFQFDEKIRKDTRKKLNISDDQKVFLFTGSQFYPNIEAFKFLKNWAEDHSDELRTHNIVILVVGSVALIPAMDQGLKVVGRVEKIMPYFWASDYGINPITLGSGTNVKMIEFLAAGIPIITTKFGSRGLNLIDEETCFEFERNKLIEKIKTAAKLNLSDRQLMASRALKENLPIVDMEHALKNASIQW